MADTTVFVADDRVLTRLREGMAELSDLTRNHLGIDVGAHNMKTMQDIRRGDFEGYFSTSLYPDFCWEVAIREGQCLDNVLVADLFDPGVGKITLGANLGGIHPTCSNGVGGTMGHHHIADKQNEYYNHGQTKKDPGPFVLLYYMRVSGFVHVSSPRQVGKKVNKPEGQDKNCHYPNYQYCSNRPLLFIFHDGLPL